MIDVEGAELQVIEGGERVLDMTPKPVWLTEVSINELLPGAAAFNPNLQKTFQKFWDHGYAAWTADKEVRPVSPEEIDSIMKSEVNTINTHNFLFAERGHRPPKVS